MHQETGKVPMEIVAAITAAIAMMIDQPVGNFAITNIQPAVGPAPVQPSSWAKAGLIQSHLARAAFGNRISGR